jgi:hypothetical protein
MSSRWTNRCARSIATIAFAVVLLFASQSYAQRGAAAAAGPFAGLSGSWTGSGTVSLANGSNERIRCRATYRVGGDGTNLQQELRCASDSYRFELRGDVTAYAGQLSGTWTEATRNTGGSVSGRASEGQVNAIVSGPAFAASLAVSTRGDRQSVHIRADGRELSSVTITLTRSSR